MRAVLAAAVSALVGVVGVIAAGCIVFTGSTDGYHPVDAGGDGEGGPGVSLACVSSADCQSADGGSAASGGQVCCVVLSGSMTTANTACQAAPCGGILPAQLCKTSAECGKSGLCTTQSCNFGTGSVTIAACGTLNGCTPQ